MGEAKLKAAAQGLTTDELAARRQAEEIAAKNHEMLLKALTTAPAVLVDAGVAIGTIEVFRIGVTDNGTLRGVYAMGRSAALQLAAQIVDLDQRIQNQDAERRAVAAVQDTQEAA